MRIAHVRERHAPAGAPWRLAAALGGPAAANPDPRRWLDLEVARRRMAAADPRLAHNSVLFRLPILTLDDHLARGLRVEALAELVGGSSVAGGSDPDPADDAVLDAADLRFGPPILRPPAFRDFYVFERHVQSMWDRRGGEIPEPWYRIPVFYFSNTSEIRGPDEPVWAPAGSAELDFELEVGALIDTPAVDLPADGAEAAIGGYFVLNDWSARDLQRDEMPVRMGPAKAKDFASSIGPWLVTPDELADARAPGSTGPDLAMTSSVRAADGRETAISSGTWAAAHFSFGQMLARASADVHVRAADGRETAISSGTWATAHFSFGQMLARASADVHVRAGEIMGSGTVGSGCLLEVKDATLGRFLEPGDEVALTIERLGTLRAPVVARPTR